MNVRNSLFVIVSLAALASCSFNFADDKLVERATDSVSPVITVSKPESGSACANLVEVSGTVTDITSKGGNGTVTSLSWEIPNTSLEEPSIPIRDNGTFTFILDAGELFGNFTLSLTATDWNGNITVKSVSLLREAGNTLPSFRVSPGNKTLNLEWEAVPDTAYYLVYHNPDGSIPDMSEDAGIQVAPSETSYRIEGCQNGDIYYVGIKAVAESGSSSVSGFIKALPLSPRTLCPQITASTDSLSLSWSKISATNRFEIWRRTGTSGEFGLYAETSGYGFTDRNVQKDTWYSYKVRPALEGAILSESERGITQWFERRARNIGEITTSRMMSYGKMVREGNMLYACGNSRMYSTTGFSIFDVSDAAHPAFCSYIEIPALDVSISGSTAYIVTQGFTGYNSPIQVADLVILDVEDPNNPKILSITGILDMDVDEGSFQESTTAWGLATAGNRAYIACGKDGIQEYDVSDPENPVFLRASEVDTAVFTGITAHEGVLYATCINYAEHYYGLVAYDRGTMAVLAGIESGDLDSDTYFAYTVGSRLVTHNYSLFGNQYSQNLLYVMDNQNGVHVFNAFYPESPEYMYTIDTPGFPQDVRLDDGMLYIADGSGSLQVCKQSPDNPLRYKLDGSLVVPIPMNTAGIVTKDGYAFIGATFGGFQLVDLGIPYFSAAPTLVSRTENKLGEYTNGFDFLAACGPVAYVANYTGLTVIDATETEDVTWETFTPEGTAHFTTMAVSGDLLLNDDWGKLAALDISDPLHPSLLGSAVIDYQVFSIAARGEHAFVGGGDGLMVYDISNPSQIKLSAELKTGRVGSIAFSGDYAFLYGSAGLTVVDIAKPEKPFVVGIYMNRHDDGSAANIRIAGNYAYASDTYSGVYIFDISDPERIPVPKPATNDGTINGCKFIDALSAGAWTIVLKYDGTKLLYNTSVPDAPVYIKTLEGAIQPKPGEYINYISSSGIIIGRTLIALDAEGFKVYNLDR